jgi:hypothetical protein
MVISGISTLSFQLRSPVVPWIYRKKAGLLESLHAEEASGNPADWSVQKESVP